MTIAWGSSLAKTHLDAATDDPSQARGELEAVIDRINTKLATVTLIQSTDLSNNGSDGTVAETSGGGFPNVNADVTATDEDMNSVLTPYAAQRVELGGDFDAGEEVVCERIGNTVTITSDGFLSHGSSANPQASSQVIPSTFRPSTDIMDNVYTSDFKVSMSSNGGFQLAYSSSRTNSLATVSISYVITDNIS